MLLVLSDKDANAVVVRRFGNTLRDSVYQQVLWAISSLGLESYFKAKLSPMEITYLPTGQRIVFRGADDPLKLKGIKFTKGYPACIWFEELDQFDGIEAVRSILIRIRPARKARMRKLSYEWLAGLREIVIDPFRCPKTYEEFTLN